MSSHYDGAYQFIVLIEVEHACKNMIAVRGMHIDDVLQGLQRHFVLSILYHNMLYTMLQCNASSKNISSIPSQMVAQHNLCSLANHIFLLQGPGLDICGVCRNLCVTSTNILGSASMHLSYGPLYI